MTTAPAAMTGKTMTPKRSEYDDRVFVIDKAVGPTSFDVVSALRRATGLRKVGHTGTLDPLAHGVLVLCTGMATRAVEHFMDLEKEYAFTVRLGIETTTLDAEGEVVREVPCPEVSAGDLAAAAAGFVGEYDLTPPRYSAVKRGGRRLYEMARDGEDVEVPPRRVHIHAFDVTGVDLPDVRCVVRCSRGTYVRSLARDLGERVDAPAHIVELARTRVGPFTLDHAFPSDRLEARELDGLACLDLADALDFLPGVVLSVRSRRALAFGTLPEPDGVTDTRGVLATGPVRLLDDGGRLLAIGLRRDDGERNRLTVVDSFRLIVDPDTLG
jgi:tRNA pseudouridine55 synthase